MRRSVRPPVELAARVTVGAVFENAAGERVLVTKVKSFGGIVAEFSRRGEKAPMGFSDATSCADWLQAEGFAFVGHEQESKS